MRFRLPDTCIKEEGYSYTDLHIRALEPGVGWSTEAAFCLADPCSVASTYLAHLGTEPRYLTYGVSSVQEGRKVSFCGYSVVSRKTILRLGGPPGQAYR